MNENTVNLLEASIHQHCQGSSNSHQLARSLRGWPMRPCVRSRVIWCDLKHRLTAFGSIAWPRAAHKSFKSDLLEGGYSDIGIIDWPWVPNRKHPLAAVAES